MVCGLYSRFNAYLPNMLYRAYPNPEPSPNITPSKLTSVTPMMPDTSAHPINTKMSIPQRERLSFSLKSHAERTATKAGAEYSNTVETAMPFRFIASYRFQLKKSKLNKPVPIKHHISDILIRNAPLSRINNQVPSTAVATNVLKKTTCIGVNPNTDSSLKNTPVHPQRTAAANIYNIDFLCVDNSYSPQNCMTVRVMYFLARLQY